MGLKNINRTPIISEGISYICNWISLLHLWNCTPPHNRFINGVRELQYAFTSVLDSGFWNNYKIPTERLETQGSFMLKAQALHEEMGLDFPIHHHANCKFSKRWIRKQHTDYELMAIAMESIARKYPLSGLSSHLYRPISWNSRYEFWSRGPLDGFSFQHCGEKRGFKLRGLKNIV